MQPSSFALRSLLGTPEAQALRRGGSCWRHLRTPAASAEEERPAPAPQARGVHLPQRDTWFAVYQQEQGKAAFLYEHTAPVDDDVFMFEVGMPFGHGKERLVAVMRRNKSFDNLLV